MTDRSYSRRVPLGLILVGEMLGAIAPHLAWAVEPKPAASATRLNARFYRPYADGPLTGADYAGTRGESPDVESFHAELAHNYQFRRRSGGATVVLAMTTIEVSPVMWKTKSYLPDGDAGRLYAAMHQLEFDVLDLISREATAELGKLGDPYPQITTEAATLAEAEQALGEAISQRMAPFLTRCQSRRRELRADVAARGQAAVEEWRVRIAAERKAAR